MSKYIVTQTETFMSIVYEDSEEDAEHDAVMSQYFKFVDQEYTVEEAGD